MLSADKIPSDIFSKHPLNLRYMYTQIVFIYIMNI